MTFNLVLTKKLNFNLPNKVFLGNWCLNNNFKINNEKIIPYHWDDRKKLYKDFIKINKIYEKKLKFLSYKLNRYHKKTYSTKYWESLIGLWLKQILQITFDVVYMLNYTKKEIADFKIISVKYNSNELIPNSFSEFRNQISNDDWRTLFYLEIAQKLYPRFIINKDLEFQINNVRKKNYNKIYLKKMISYICLNIFKTFKFKYFFLNHGLRIKDYILLNIKLLQVPLFFFDKEFSAPSSNIDNYFRNSLKNNSKNYEKITDEIILKFIPKCYLEDYKNFFDESINYFPNVKCKSIMRTSNIFKNDLFIFFASYQKEFHKSNIIFGQHGGNYGISKFNTFQDHEINFSTYYLSWGWKNNIKKVVQFGKYNDQKFKLNKFKNKKDILLVLGSCPKYFYIIYSIFISSQFIFYLNMQINFIKLINNNNNIFKNLKVRLYHKSNHQWNEKQYLSKRFKSLNFDDNETISNSLKSCRLFISTYNATTYLESMHYNIPTIIFWDTKYWELDNKGKKYFEDLKRNNIFFDCEKNAAKFIVENFDSIEDWWFSKNVQLARKKFINEYCRKFNLNTLINTIKNER